MSHTDDMSRLAQEMHSAYDSRTAAVGALHTSTRQQLAGLHAQHRAMAAAQRQELEQSTQLLRRDAANKNHDRRVEREALGADQRRRLQAYTQDLRQNLGRFLKDQAAARAAERERQRVCLGSSMESLRASTASCLADAHKVRQALHTDHAEARRAWREFNTAMRERRSGPR